jgi:hypothetical protein
MKNLLRSLVQIIIRLVIPGALFILAFYLISSADQGFASLAGLFIAMGCFVIGAFLMASPVAKLIAGPAGILYFPKGEAETFPMYAIADSYVKRGLFHKAFQEYSKIAEIHPEELKPYVEMIKVSKDHLKDLELADSVLIKGISVFKGKEGEKILSAMFPEKESKAKEDRVLEAFDESVKKFEK